MISIIDSGNDLSIYVNIDHIVSIIDLTEDGEVGIEDGEPYSVIKLSTGEVIKSSDTYADLNEGIKLARERRYLAGRECD